MEDKPKLSLYIMQGENGFAVHNNPYMGMQRDQKFWVAATPKDLAMIVQKFAEEAITIFVENG